MEGMKAGQEVGTHRQRPLGKVGFALGDAVYLSNEALICRHQAALPNRQQSLIYPKCRATNS